jgi:hypothetical protein
MLRESVAVDLAIKHGAKDTAKTGSLLSPVGYMKNLVWIVYKHVA